jgi:hypothetical protein
VISHGAVLTAFIAVLHTGELLRKG